MEAPAVGSHVKFHRNHPEGIFDATVTGYDRQNDHDIDLHGLPDINLVYLDPSKTMLLAGAGWREAFERVYGVPHEDVNDGGPNHYSLAPAAKPIGGDQVNWDASLPSASSFTASFQLVDEETLKTLSPELQATAERVSERSFRVKLEADDSPKPPSDADLDAAAAAAEAEAKAKAATSGDKPKARIVKGSKAQ